MENENKPLATWKSQVFPFLVCLVLAIVFLFPINPIIRPFAGNDSGVFLYIGNGLLHGKIPYVDIWDHKPPLTYFINALSLIMTPHSTWGIYIVQIFFLSTCNFLLYSLLSRSLKKIFVFLLIAVFDLECILLSAGGNLTSFYTLPFQLLAFYGLVKISESQNTFKVGLLTGIAFACTLLIRQTSIGPFVALALVILINKSLRNIKLVWRWGKGFAVGALIISLPLFIFFAYHKALIDLWDQVVIFNTYYAGKNSLLDKLLVIKEGIGILAPTGLIFLSFLGLFPLILQVIRRQKISPLQKIVIISWIFDWIFISWGGRDKVPYYATMLPSSVLLAGIGLQFLSSRFSKASIRNILLIPAFLYLGYLFVGYYNSSVTIGEDQIYSRGKIIQYITQNTTPDDKILVWGNETWIYFHSNREAADRFIYVNPLYFTDYATGHVVSSYFKRIIDSKPKLLISTIEDGSISNHFIKGKSAKREEQILEIQSLYEPVLKVGQSIVYQRIDSK